MKSFPSMVYLEYRYRKDVTLPNKTIISLKFQSSCGGTLIYNQNYQIFYFHSKFSCFFFLKGTLIKVKSVYCVISAAHCFPKSVKMNGKYYTVETNNFYPTMESMISVYLGVHNNKHLTNNSRHLVSVSHLVVVGFF